MSAPYTIVEGDGPLVATALHDGHDARSTVQAALPLTVPSVSERNIRLPDCGPGLPRIEMKKVFMDEWTGKPDAEAILQIGDALTATLSQVLDMFRRTLGAPEVRGGA